jgi:hypothetical protein
MNFRNLLVTLDRMENEEYTSGEVAISLAQSVRNVSNDLRRVHQMGFLKRKRIRRVCLSKTGKPCFKGCEYKYSLSEQGRSYLAWMREKKSFEDVAQTSLDAEVLSYLPHDLRNRLLTIVAIRNSRRYRGPSRHFRLVDNEVLPIANLMLENRRLSERNRDLNSDNATLVSSIAFYKGFTQGLTQNIEEYRKREAELTKSVYDFLPQVVRSEGLYYEFIDILRTIIKSNRDSRDLMLHIIFRFLPEEKFKQAYELLLAFEKKGQEEVERKKNALIGKIQIGSESGRES